jgi:hypothetical protein
MEDHVGDLVDALHREAVARYWEEGERARRLVEEVHRQGVQHYQEELERQNELVDRVHHEALERVGQHPVPPAEGESVHYTELPEAKPDSPLYREWNVYRQEAGRLLGEGKAGKHVLIKNDEIVAIWDTHDEAMADGHRRFLGQPFLVHEVQEREHVLRCVTVRQWRNLHFQSRLAS